MNKETLEMLQALAAKLGTTAEHLWSVLIRQAYISFVTDLFGYLVAAGVVYALIRIVKELHGIEENPITKENPAIAFEIGLGIAAVVICAAAFFQIPFTVTKIANPEYWALMQIFDAMKGVK